MRKFLSCALIAMALLVSCSDKEDARRVRMNDIEGTKINWYPAPVRVADEVGMSVVETLKKMKLAADGTTGTELRDGEKQVVVPVQDEIWKGKRFRRYTFRVKKPGEYTWGSDQNARILWKVDTASGDAKDLKVLDADRLWKGNL